MSRPATATVGVRLAWAVGLCAMLATSAARGDTQRHEARAHFDRAVVLLEQKKYPGALEELEAAYALHPHPAVLYNIGMAHVAMGSSVAAAKSLERYLREAGSSVTPERRAETQRVLDELAPRLATLVLDLEPRGARVTLNGVVVAAAEPITVAAGKHELVITHAGHRTDRRSLELKGRTVTSLQVRLDPAKSASRERVHLGIDCPVPDATVYLDDVAVARTPLSSMLISPGPHRVAFRRAGYAASEHSVLAAKGVESVARCQLVAKGSGKMGRVVLVGPAASGRAWVDGRELPAGGRVAPGRHRVKLTAAGHRPWEGDVSVAAGRTLTLGEGLVPTEETLRARATQRTWAWALGAQGLGLAVAGASIYYWNSNRYQTWKERQARMDEAWAKPPYRDPALMKRQVQNDDLRDSIKQFDLLSAVLAVGGAVLLTTGTALYLTGESPHATTEPAITATPSGIRGQWSARW
ncbi:MAG: PEGA domain-containing protein [Polyangiaceae bacterium]|nr:PEGA domain-containing protein [Polyangiaceae bacterium]MCL4752607.1 PEGA domain-containing protein [Myxococcales bacterium]